MSKMLMPPPGGRDAGNILACSRREGEAMGRIGKSYPRFEERQPAAPAQDARSYRFQLLGAVLGILAALGLIGWLLTR